MRRFILFAILAAVAWAQAIPSAGPEQEPSSPNEASSNASPQSNAPSPAADSNDYSKESYVAEKYQVRMRFENDGTGRREETARIRVQSEAGVKRWGQLVFGYNSANERMEIPYVRVLKKDGPVVTAGADAVQDLNQPVQRLAPVYTDYREKHVTVPGLRAGDVLEWQTLVTINTAYAPGQFWAQRNFTKNTVVLDEQLEIDIPASRVIKIKTRPGYDPKISEENGRRIYRWSASNLETAAAKAAADKVKDKKKKKKKSDEAADVQLTSFGSWEEVGRWYAGLEKDRRVPSPAVKAKAEELTKNQSSDIAKIEALYDYTALSSRYVSLALGLGRYQPQAADDVLKNQYGDCKDKNTLLAALLEAEGFHSSSVLIGTQHKLDPDIPSPAQFNHVITMVPLANEEIWLDTTSEVAPFRLLAFSLRKKQALVIPENGTPRLEETPADSVVPDTNTLVIDGKIDDAGKLDASISTELRGDPELLLRSKMRAVASSQYQQVFEDASKKEGMGNDITEVKVSDPAATRQPFSFSYRVSKANYLDLAKKKSELKPPLSTIALASANPDDADSPDPIELGPVSTYHYKVKLVFPSHYTIHPPLPIAVKRDYASYEVTYKVEGPVLTADRTLKILQSELPSSRVDDYLAFRRSVLEEAAQKISLETDVVSAASAPAADAKPDDLFRRGNEARREGNYTLAIDLLKRGVDADPKTKNGWNELGIAYLDSKQDDLAIAAFQKQIEAAPYHQYAYENTGRIYMRQRRYDEAIKWFNKQLDVDPLNKNAHSNLGIAYLEEHKYAEALPDLEKTVSLIPDSAEARVRLGEAYLNLDQDEKAMAAFDQAIKISATTNVWNNIAYQLSLKKAHLEVARSYAESAVASTTASLRVLSLDNLETRDLGRTAMLAMCWDTLGWVAFAEGKPDQATKYLTAAWQLFQKSDMADHLGQVLEKQGDRDRAARFYALAMNAQRPDPETRDRLVVLLGSGAKADAMIAKVHGDFAGQSVIHVANPSKVDGKADFFVLLKSASGDEAAVDSVKFVSGEEKLKPLGDSIRASHFDQALPDQVPVKLLRRGTLTCSAAADCAFQLVPPDEVRQVN